MMEIGRFLIKLEKEREKVFKKRKGRKFRFSEKKKFQFESLKGLFLKEVRMDRKKTNFYKYPLVETVGYTYDRTRYYLKTGLKKNLIIKEDRVSVYNVNGKDWLNIRFNYQKKMIGYLFRNKWFVGARRYRKYLNKKNRYEKWLYTMHFRIRKKEKDAPLMKILKKGVPAQIGRHHSRVSYTREVIYTSVNYFLKERFLKELKAENYSHGIELLDEKKRRKRRIRWKLKRKKKGLVLWDRPLGLIFFSKEGLVKRCPS